MGRTEDGLNAVEEALTVVRKTGATVPEADLHRLKGELLLRRDAANWRQAEDCFRQAIEIASRQSAKSYELRAATGLARLWCDQGRRAAARDLLGPVYAWFTEGFDTADLKDAQALLDELG
jgi:predicted ATPase